MIKYVLSNKLIKAMRQLPRQDSERILSKIKAFANNYPDTAGFDLDKMAGQDRVWRMRVGNYRVIFALRDQEMIITNIGHRKEIY